MPKQNENKKILSIEDVAVFLGISTATVRNWTKCGNLKTISNNTNNFHIHEIQKLKENIRNGKIQKLSGRANKSKLKKTFIPDEYFSSDENIDVVHQIVSFVKENEIEIKSTLFLLSLNLLKEKDFIQKLNIEEIISGNTVVSNNKQVGKEINTWAKEITFNKPKHSYSFLLNCKLPQQRDILGFIYQSLFAEGKKSQSGSYYTPELIVEKITNEYVKSDSKVLDPCCGTGQFLLAFSDKIDDPKNIYGFDIDEIAVRIARINLLVKYRNKKFTPNIFCKNTLLEIGNYDTFSLNAENIKDFDVVATNPPWGVHFLKIDIGKLKTVYPKIKSIESFSYFLSKSIDLLDDKGVISFILPESILNVKTHKDIREIILKNTDVKKVFYLDRIFKNVFTPVIRLDLSKKRNNEDIEIIKQNEKHKISQSRWKNNEDFIFDIHSNNFDKDIIDKVYNTRHINLKNNADWALGIVTGNNKKYVNSEKIDNSEPIYKGKDIEKFIIKKPNNYIVFTPENFQQVAPVAKYRTKEKLIYKFISKKLVFAYDNKQRLTLNSANIVIPKIEHYPIKFICALFNSSLYQFIFQKKFSSIKVLRSHIEQLPLPIWNEEIIKKITSMVDEIINNKSNFESLDNYIFKQFNFSVEDIKYISSST